MISVLVLLAGYRKAGRPGLLRSAWAAVFWELMAPGLASAALRHRV